MTDVDKLPVRETATGPQNTTAQDQPAPRPKVGRAGVAAGAVSLPAPQRAGETARRITAIHLPDFAMERWLRWASRHSMCPPDDLPVILAQDGPHGPIVYATNRAALGAGIAKQMRVVDARAICPDVRVEFADIGGDQAALGQLVLWARQWCPWTAQDGPAGLVLDTTGSDHLWGGEAAMLRMMEERFARIGLSTQLGCAPTHGAAWALARLGNVREICTATQLENRIAPMPARALRIDAGTVQLLQRLGLKTIGDVAAVPRVSLARRFSNAPLTQNPLLRLDQMTGHLAEPISAAADPPRFAVRTQLPEAIQDPTPHLDSLCQQLCTDLKHAGKGARYITVTVYRTDGETRTVTVKTAQASRDAPHIHRLFDDKITQIDPGFGFDLITLSASGIETVGTVQNTLDRTAQDSSALTQLIDRLCARLGPKYVSCPQPKPSHLPERTTIWSPAVDSAPQPPLEPLAQGRPQKLFDHPEEIHVLYAVPEGPPAQFIWRKLTHRVVRYAGPERIAPEWWRDMPNTRLRDYYRIEDQNARRLWLYREGVWGDARGSDPRWFIHGVFA